MLISEENIQGLASLKKSILDLQNQAMNDIQAIKADIDKMKQILIELQSQSEQINQLSKKLNDLING